MVGLGFSQRPELRAEQSLLLEAELRLAVKTHLLNQRLELLQVVRGYHYEPHATCPHCTRNLNLLQILQGFNQDPADFTTVCSHCKTRFNPKMVCSGNGWRIELPFYCRTQSLAQLGDKSSLSPEEFNKKEAALYHSLIFHFGSLKNAFQHAGQDYKFEEKIDWETKIKPFLGQMPDTVIARYAGVSRRTIGRLRKELKIPRFLVSDLRDELE